MVSLFEERFDLNACHDGRIVVFLLASEQMIFYH